ncbi:hypothetical protein [Fibrivirga algicola]|uniref:NUMOD4 domain-containing protein n=1 Tax=Fibrivirga algicola TaxID=2950420 RepID=A0ABX0QET9_9BACT|nr:hypothetical protein [Fibrivirga algicola]NID09497.1 hypothetical protein [Fibrivirga algicola]
MTKHLPSYQQVERVWDIDGFPNYFFGNDKRLYRFDTRGRLWQNKRIILRYTAGYVLKSRFYSLSQLRPMLRPHRTTADRRPDF